jgi:tRNA 5-methylaminomethyl-2-thiouridine biosynthesis bifunctional protein
MTVSPARLGAHPCGEAGQPPYAPDYCDVYHPSAGAWQQARGVFLRGNGLPGRWQGRDRFTILETGFGLGNNCLATWAAWRQDPQRCDRLFFISIEKHPLRPDDLAAVHGLPNSGEPFAHPSATLAAADLHDLPPQATQEAESPEYDARWRRTLAARLHAAWPPLTPGWHTIELDRLVDANGLEQSLTLMLGLGDVADLLPGLQASVDAFYLDGFTPARNPQMWHAPMLSRINRLTAADATAATWSSARAVRDALTQAQFEVKKRLGEHGKWATTVARHQPRFSQPPTPGGLWPTPSRRDAIVIGAGIAGCSAADALTREGWSVTLLDASAGPAQGASGNPGGLFHTIVHGDDGIHARVHRAAALSTWRRVRGWIDNGALPGQANGLLRLDPKQDAVGAQALLERLPWLGEQATWLDQAQARARCGLPVSSGGWWFPQAGWMSPADACQLLLDTAMARCHQNGESLLRTRWSTPVQALTRTDGTWRALDAQGQVLAEAGSIVVANAWQANALLDTLPADQAVACPPVSAVRGQVSVLPCDLEGASKPLAPVAGQGYVLTLNDGRLLCGATTQHHDSQAAQRMADHVHNLSQALRLGALPAGTTEQQLMGMAESLFASAGHPGRLTGRVGWRATTPDRLPLVGALPWHPDRWAAQPPARAEQVRMLPRERSEHGGLYLIGGLGSRGLTWSMLAGELLAHWVCGTPCPVEAELRDALDPARFLARQNRHA